MEDVSMQEILDDIDKLKAKVELLRKKAHN